MKATNEQKTEIKRLAKLAFGEKWLREVDGICAINAHENKWQYTGLSSIDNFQAMWLIDELKPRADAMMNGRSTGTCWEERASR